MSGGAGRSQSRELTNAEGFITAFIMHRPRATTDVSRPYVPAPGGVLAIRQPARTGRFGTEGPYAAADSRAGNTKAGGLLSLWPEFHPLYCAMVVVQHDDSRVFEHGEHLL